MLRHLSQYAASVSGQQLLSLSTPSKNADPQDLRILARPQLFSWPALSACPGELWPS